MPHFREFFPRHFEILGQSAMRHAVRESTERAERFGLLTQREACLYSSLELMLGIDFPTDPQLPWAAAILSHPAMTDSFQRASNLYDRAMDYVDRVAGPQDEYAERVLAALQTMDLDALRALHRGDLLHDFTAACHLIYPEKAAEVGDDNLARLVELGRRSAAAYSITQPDLVGVMLGFMYLLGSGFARDPRFPFAAPILNDRTLEQVSRVERLTEAARTALAQWLRQPQ